MKTKADLARIAAALSEDICGVEVKFGQKGKTLTFKCHRVLAETLIPGDMVICEDGPWGIFSVLEVVQVTDTFDPDEEITYKWAFAKLDPEPLAGLREWEERTVEALYRTQRRESQKAMLHAIGPDAHIPALLPPGPIEAPESGPIRHLQDEK